MWPDNDTNVDFLNFTGVADTVAELVLQADGRPISIGVSGAWGTGKSSLIRLIRASLDGKSSDTKEFVFVEFNAWLYQGYDDARAALVPENPDPDSPVFVGGGTRPNNRFRVLCDLAGTAQNKQRYRRATSLGA